MAGKDIIIMTKKELSRLHVIRQVLERKLSQDQAGKLLSLSDRQIRRLVKKVREDGSEGIVHGLRGVESNRKLSDQIKQQVLLLYRERYAGFGPTLAQEKLLEREKIKIGTQTLRNWLIGEGLWQVRRKRRKYRRWRERKACKGELVQIDGSHHDWFEGRGLKCVLMGYIDDASNEVYGRFYEYEGTEPAMDSFKRYARKHGLAYSVYLDKHTTYKSWKKLSVQEELEGKTRRSEFERAMKELGVKVIHAHSPQAKGRIERTFKTFQDRVIKEMRLEGIKSIEEGNTFLEKYLPKYNKRFSIEARSEGIMYRPVGRISLEGILCYKKERVLRNDYTVAHNKELYQVLEQTSAKRVTVETRLNGKIHLVYEGKKLRYKKIKQRPIKPKKSGPGKKQRAHKPAKEHIWKKPVYWSYRPEKRAQNKALHELNEEIVMESSL